MTVKRMSMAAKSVDVSRLPEVLSLAEEVRATGEPRVLRRNDEVSRGSGPDYGRTTADAEAEDSGRISPPFTPPEAVGRTWIQTS